MSAEATYRRWSGGSLSELRQKCWWRTRRRLLGCCSLVSMSQAAPGSSSVQALVLPLKILSYALTCFTKGCARTLLYLARALRVQGACLFAHGTAAHWPCMVRTGV